MRQLRRVVAEASQWMVPWWPPRGRLALHRAAIAVALAGAGYLAYAVWRPQHVSCHAASCYIPVDLAASMLAALIAYLAYFAATHGWVLWGYQRQARGEPETLLPDHRDIPELQQISCRPLLCEQIAERIRRSAVQRPDSKSRGVPLVLGDLGSGKSTFMVSLAAYLAERGVIPVLVSLRNEKPPFDLPALARKCFLRQVDRRLLSETAADRLWRQVWRQQLIVVLADGLDEALYEGQLMDAGELSMGVANRKRCQLIVASRPESLVSERGFHVLKLDPLSRTELIGRMTDRGSALALSRQAAGRLIDTLDLPSTPFFLEVWKLLVENIATEDVRLDELAQGIFTDSSTGRRASLDRARVQLLDRYREAMVMRVMREFGVRERDVEQSVAALARVAIFSLGLPSIERERFSDLSLSTPGDLASRLGSLGRRLGLLAETQPHKAGIRFRHPILHAYVASLRLAHDPEEGVELARQLLEGIGFRADEVLLTLRMFAARDETPTPIRMDVAELIFGHAEPADSLPTAVKYTAAAVRVATSDGSTSSADWALDSAGAALEDSRAPYEASDRRDPDSGMESAVDDHAGDSRAVFSGVIATGALGQLEGDLEASRLDLVQAVANLARAGSDSRRAYELLWSLSKDRSYAIRWQLVEALAIGAGEAFEVIGPNVTGLMNQVDACLDALERGEPEDSRLEASFFPDLSVIAKFLPSVVARQAGNGEGDRAHRELDRLVGIVARAGGLHKGLGVEASLAQGFKFAAGRRGARVLDRSLFGDSRQRSAVSATPELGLSGLTFWYARVNLLQAAARRVLTLIADGDDPETIKRARKGLRDAQHDPHPFVKATAEMCARATSLAKRSRREEAESYLWADESVEVAGAASHLNPRAHSLLADIVITLNMNEQDRRDGLRPQDGHDSFGRAQRLPVCLTHGMRAWLLASDDACPRDAVCKLSLCPYRPGRAKTAAYRRISQAFYEHQKGLVHDGDRLPWQRGIAPDLLARFWDQMAERERLRRE